MFRPDHMLPRLHVSRRDAVTKRAASPLPDNVACSQLHSVAPKNDVPVPLWQEIYDMYAFGALVLSAYSPHMPTVVTSSSLKMYDSSQHSCIYISIFGSVCALLVFIIQ